MASKASRGMLESQIVKLLDPQPIGELLYKADTTDLLVHLCPNLLVNIYQIYFELSIFKGKKLISFYLHEMFSLLISFT